jgi:hypothetical protein
MDGWGAMGMAFVLWAGTCISLLLSSQPSSCGVLIDMPMVFEMCNYCRMGRRVYRLRTLRSGEMHDVGS